jgi:hypothetical protein
VTFLRDLFRHLVAIADDSKSSLLSMKKLSQ